MWGKWWRGLESLVTILQLPDFLYLPTVKQLTAQNFTPQCGRFVEQFFH